MKQPFNYLLPAQCEGLTHADCASPPGPIEPTPDPSEEVCAESRTMK